VVLDAGDVFGNSGLQGQIKAETTVEAMGMMSYNILNLCDHEFNYGVEFLLDNTEQFNVPTISANVVYEDTGSSITAPHKIVEFDKFKVGFIGIVSTEYEEAILESNEINERRIMLLDEKAALQDEIDEIDDEVDIIIVLAHVGMENATSIAEEIEGIDVIICGHGDEITEEPSLINGVYVVKAAYYGMEVGNLVLTLANNRIISIEGSIVTLDDSISEDEELLLLMDTYHDRIEEHKDELLDIEQKDPDEGWYYTGYAICESCHQSQTEHWGSTDHAKAFTSLKVATRAKQSIGVVLIMQKLLLLLQNKARIITLSVSLATRPGLDTQEDLLCQILLQKRKAFNVRCATVLVESILKHKTFLMEVLLNQRAHNATRQVGVQSSITPHTTSE